MKVRILLVTALLSIGALPAAAQSVKVSFHGGKVDLVRARTPRCGRSSPSGRASAARASSTPSGSSGPPMTVEFKDAYEQRVLEALLRNVAGYIVGPRPIAGAASASGFDRIVILPTSTAPRRPSSVTPAVSRPPGPQPIRRLPMPIDDVTGRRPTTTSTRPWPMAAGGARARKRLQTCAAVSVRFSKPSPTTTRPNRSRPPTAPANPFGVTTGAARPGVITPVPAARPGAAPSAADARRSLAAEPHRTRRSGRDIQ